MSHAQDGLSQEKLPSSFKKLAWSNLAAQSAEQIGLAASPIFAVVALGAGTGESGLIQTAQTLPFLILAIPAGVLADHMSRVKLMAWSEATRVASLAAIVMLALVGKLTFAELALLGMVGACGTVVYSVTAPALIPSLVPPAKLPAANGRIELARTAAFAGGPALGGALVGSIGAAPAFALAASLSAVAVLLLSRIPVGPPRAKSTRHPLVELREGAAFVFRRKYLRPVFVTQFVFAIASFALQAVYVPYAINTLGFSASVVGITLAAFGIGMMTGALLAPILIRAWHFGAVILFGPISGFLAAVAMVTTIWIPSPILSSASFFVLGVGPIVWVVSTTTLRQTVTPTELLGRVSAINSAAYGARPIGAGLGALIGGVFGAETCLVFAAAVFALQAAIIALSPLRALRRPPA